MSRLFITLEPSPTINATTSSAIGTLYQRASFVQEAMRPNFRSVEAPFVAIISLAILNILT
jgi:hypothetical protein